MQTICEIINQFYQKRAKINANQNLLIIFFSFEIFYQDEHTFENEWDVALPYSKLPGPTAFQLVSRFLPGGKLIVLSRLNGYKK